LPRHIPDSSHGQVSNSIVLPAGLCASGMVPGALDETLCDRPCYDRSSGNGPSVHLSTTAPYQSALFFFLSALACPAASPRHCPEAREGRGPASNARSSRCSRWRPWSSPPACVGIRPPSMGRSGVTCPGSGAECGAAGGYSGHALRWCVLPIPRPHPHEHEEEDDDQDDDDDDERHHQARPAHLLLVRLRDVAPELVLRLS